MELPHRFGRYELLELLATGGMAEIYRARSFGVDGFEKHLVIKRILPALARDPRFVGLFVKEARLGASLSHPNLVQVYELGRVADDHYIAMEYVHGRDLARVSRELRHRSESRIMPVDVAVHVVVSVLRALHCAHSLRGPDGERLGLVHRDVSPHNIMLGFEGEVKLFDFGIAGLDGDSPLNGGKPGYQAPEQIRGEPVTAQTDVFAVGIVLWELITGQRLFGGADLEAKRAAVLQAELPDPREVLPDLPDALVEVLQRMLHADPAERPPTAEQAAEQLSAALFPAISPADGRRVRALVRELFPDIARRPVGSAVDLSGLARDLAALQDKPVPPLPTSALSTTGTRSGPPEGGAPGRKQVVVLTGEVVGLTDLSVQVESEQIVRHNLRFLRRVRRAVGRNGGVLQSWQDETFVAFFGLPRTREHDLERALACAAEVRDAAASLGDQGPRTDVVLSVHTGVISLGRSSGRRLRYIAHGDTVKLGRRLCMEGDSNEILVSDLVARLARRRWHLARGPRVRLRGNPDPTQSWRLLRPRRRVETAGGRWMPRREELATLRAALESLDAGRGGHLAVVGSAGSGKSRLLRELSGLARRRGVGVFAVRGMPVASGRGQRVLRDLGAALLGLDPSGSREARDEALARLEQLDLEPGERSGLRRLFLAQGDAGLRSRSGRLGSRRQPSVVRLLAGLIRAVSASHPLILAVEDAPHLRPATRVELGQLMRSTAELPVLWWVSGRQEDDALPAPGWRIALRPLERSLVARLCAELLGAEQVDPGLLQRIQRASEGNPLFVESLISSLLREGRVRIEDGTATLRRPTAPLPAPPDLDAIVAERVDRLEPELRGMLQLAAVIGSSLPTALLREASGLERASELIEGLVDQGLLVVDLSRPTHLLFASPLVWSVVHRSLLGRERRAAHGAVALAIERLHGGQLTDHWDALAIHLAGAGRLLDAARAARRSGEVLSEQQLLSASAETFEQALVWVGRARDGDEDEDACAVAEALLSLDAGTARVLDGHLGMAERHLQLALELGSELWLPEVEGRAQLQLGELYRSQHREELAAAHLDGALESARLHVDEDWARELSLDALESLGGLHHQSGDVDAARAAFEAARVQAAGDPRHTGRAQLGLATLMLRSGHLAEAQSLLEEARAAARAVGDRILEGRAVNNIGIVHHTSGAYSAALDCFQEARRIREALGYRRGLAVNLHNIGDTRARMGESALAWAAFSESRALAREMRWRQGVVMNEMWLAWLELEGAGSAEDARRAGRRLEAAVERARQVGDPETALTGRWLLGRALAQAGRRDDALVELESARQHAASLDARVLARDLAQAIEQVRC
jgi:serine/threonine protein kinase/tetratricopeptide (TPR) repeat protein/energy-coupling factor transporter ATP-binding protein EcfA2